MNRKLVFSIISVMALFSLAAWAAAQERVPAERVSTQVSVGSSFTYQGQLKSGGTEFDGSCDFQFRLFDMLDGGNQVSSTQTVTSLSVRDGFFTTDLNFGSEAFDGSARWLGVGVRCPAGSGSYTTLSPRQSLSAIPYAMSLKPGAVIINTEFNPGGDPMPTAITGRATASSGYTIAILGEAYSPDGRAVSGDNYSSNGGTGVWGWSGATIGPAAGVRGSAHSPEGAGIWGDNQATTGEGKGILGDSNSPDGVGVFGYNDDGGDGVVGISHHDGSGVNGTALSDSSYGVSGVNEAATGWGIGVFGTTSSDGPAIAAENNDSGIGLWVRSAHGSLIEAVGEDSYDVEFWVSNDGDVHADGTFQSPAADFAELLPAGPGVEAGDVLVIGADGKLTRSTEPYQTTVVGVYSSQPAFLGNNGEDGEQDGRVPLALVGIVPVKVSTENGPIQPGDVLVASSTAGYAMRAEPLVVNGITFYPSGVVIGKSLGSLAQGTGVIDVLVMLQ